MDGQRPRYERRFHRANVHQVFSLFALLLPICFLLGASTSQIKESLTVLREAKAKTEENLSKAQAELKGLLTLRQEAILVTMGILN